MWRAIGTRSGDRDRGARDHLTAGTVKGGKHTLEKVVRKLREGARMIGEGEGGLSQWPAVQ